MNPTIVSTARGLNNAEASTYYNAALLAHEGPLTPAVHVAAATIEEFITQHYAHGVPFDEAKAFGESVLPRLRTMLSDQKYMDFWSNVVIVMGINGKKETFKHLRSHLERKGEGVLELGDYNSRIHALAAMGYLANKLASNSGDAVKYLKNGVDPNTWKKKKIKWRSPTHRLPSEQNVIDDLVTQSVLGLALSGQSAAEVVLSEINMNLERSRAIDAGFLAEALRSNRYIREHGLTAYYARR
jgi:hypothetical protein